MIDASFSLRNPKNRRGRVASVVVFAPLLVVCIVGHVSRARGDAVAVDSGRKSETPGRPAPQSSYRTWASAGGKYSTQAELVEFIDGAVRLRKRNGKIVSLSIERLCEADQKHLKALAAGGNIIIGRVVDVSDGVTIVVSTGKEKHTVRLKGIDPPRQDQDSEKQAIAALKKKIFLKKVQVKWRQRDESDRIVGDVYLANRCINKELAGPGNPAAGSAAAETEKARDPPGDDPTVYVTRTGKKYHREGCRFLKKSKSPMPLSRAKQTHSPCSSCNPPR